MMQQKRLIPLLLMIFLSACAGTPNRQETVRQTLFALGERSADEVLNASPLPKPQYDQVLLLATPEIDSKLGISSHQLLEGLARGLLSADQGPQVLDWAKELPENNNNNLWWLESRLETTASHADHALIPYRLNLSLRRPGSKATLWQTSLDGALNANAL